MSTSSSASTASSTSSCFELPKEGEEEGRVLNHEEVLKDVAGSQAGEASLGDKGAGKGVQGEDLLLGVRETPCNNNILEGVGEGEKRKSSGASSTATGITSTTTATSTTATTPSLKPTVVVLPEDEETQSSPPHELSDDMRSSTTSSCTTEPDEEEEEEDDDDEEEEDDDVNFIQETVTESGLSKMENNNGSSCVKTLPYLQDTTPNSSTSSDCDADSEAGTSTSSTTSIDYPPLPHVPHLNATPQRSLLKRRSESTTSEDCTAPKKKRSIAFDGVTVFYFPRAQGFTCVPSQGGSTLGMGPHHSSIRKFSLGEHASEQRRLHKQTLMRLRQQQQQNQLLQQQGEQDSLAADEETNPAGSLSSQPSSDDSDSHEEESDSDLEMDLDNYYFLQPVPTRQRRILLRESGIKKIDSVEKEECRDIRTSREFCGCSCKSYCDPDSCSCAQAGIKCQVDRLSFPCGCSRDGCANHNGRIEFNPIRVRTHFIHTLMRIELEKKQIEQANGNLHLGSSSLIASSNAQFQSSHEQHQQQQQQQQHPQQHGTANGLGAPSLMGDISLSYSQSTASTLQQHQLKAHCSFQQHWNSAANVQHPLHQQQQSSAAALVSDGNDDSSAQYKYSRSLLRDVSFSSSMELESCVNAGNYTNVHFEPLLDAMANPNLNSALNITNSQQQQQQQQQPPVFHPGDELSGREDSLDLYSTFREDSYSENSDDFSNESGDNRFTPAVTSAPIINNSHRPLEMNFIVQNGVPGVGTVNQATPGMGSTVIAPGRPSQRLNPYVDATSYYSHNHASVQTSLHHHQPPYHPSMIVHSLPHPQQSQPQQQPYHNSHSHQNTQPNMYNHGNPTNHTYSTDAAQQQQQQQTPLPHIRNHHPYNANVSQSMYNTKPEYSNGYISLEKITNGFGDYLANRQIDQGTSNGDSSTAFLSSLAHVVEIPDEVLLENGTTNHNSLPDTEVNKNVPAYTDLNTVTSYTKLEPFTEILQGAAKGACKNTFQTLQQINRDDEDAENKDGEGEPESHSHDDGITDNFGEIIKKSMVETVSA